MIEVWHSKWLKPTDGNLYVDRSHPPANIPVTPIKFYERLTPTHSNSGIYQRNSPPISIDEKTGTAGKPYFTTTFFSQFTEGPRYNPHKYFVPAESLYH